MPRVSKLGSREWWRASASTRSAPSSTQFDEVSDKTAIRYLKELKDKYVPGSTIADVPSNKTGVNRDIFEVNQGDKLKGQMILEVPVQKHPVSESVLRYAAKEKI